MKYEDHSHLFRNLIFKDDSMTIGALLLFNDYNVNHNPPYQRNFIWPFTKSTNYIETLLLYSESNPLVWIDCNNSKELIDGRQRYETLSLFLKNKFSLQECGLDQMKALASKRYIDLDESLKTKITDTPIRIIEIIVKNENEFDEIKLDKIKRGIFYRYNKGIIQLKKHEVQRAQFIENKIILFFRASFENDSQFLNQVKAIFNHKAKNTEVLLQQIRQSLVIHNIPITRFAHLKDEIVNDYFESLSKKTVETDNIAEIYNNFREKIFFLFELVSDLSSKFEESIGLVNDCLFWALSICEKEKIKFERVNHPLFKKKLLKFLIEHKQLFTLENSYHYANVKKRFEAIASFFEPNFEEGLFQKYLRYAGPLFGQSKNSKTLPENNTITVTSISETPKIMPQIVSIREILDWIERGKINVQPKYQRDEVIDYHIASSLIESILFNLSLHPIYLYLNKDNIYEVVDGQQRILTILGFLGKAYINNKGQKVNTQKHNFFLRLEGSDLNKLTFEKLNPQQQITINNFKLHAIILKSSELKDLKPQDFFKRINHKPCPIRPHSFELWNSYIDNRIISRIKGISKKNIWLNLRIKDNRMLNEELITYLVFLTQKTKGVSTTLSHLNKFIQTNFNLKRVTVKMTTRSQITNALENPSLTSDLIQACSILENNFIRKIQTIYNQADHPNSIKKELDSIFAKGGGRTKMGFLIIWIALLGIPIELVPDNRDKIKDSLKRLFISLKKMKSKEAFETSITNMWNEYQNNETPKKNFSSTTIVVSRNQKQASQNLYNNKTKSGFKN